MPESFSCSLLLVAGCLRGTLRAQGVAYDVGTGTQTTLREIVTVARRIMGIDVEPDWGSMPGRTWDTTVWAANSRAFGVALGWQPRHDLKDGLRRMVGWLLRRPVLVRWYHLVAASAPAHPAAPPVRRAKVR